jgi:hypothetical protein
MIIGRIDRIFNLLELRKMQIIHIMADGTVRDSVEGLVIPKGDFYKILDSILEKQNKVKKQIKGGNTYERSCNH